jgi:hypothetical protein
MGTAGWISAKSVKVDGLRSKWRVTVPLYFFLKDANRDMLLTPSAESHLLEFIFPIWRRPRSGYQEGKE